MSEYTPEFCPRCKKEQAVHSSGFAMSRPGELCGAHLDISGHSPEDTALAECWEIYAGKLEAALREIEDRTRPAGDMADRAVNELARAALKVENQ